MKNRAAVTLGKRGWKAKKKRYGKKLSTMLSEAGRLGAIKTNEILLKRRQAVDKKATNN